MMMVIGTPSSHSKIGSIVSLLISKSAIENHPSEHAKMREAPFPGRWAAPPADTPLGLRQPSEPRPIMAGSMPRGTQGMTRRLIIIT